MSSKSILRELRLRPLPVYAFNPPRSVPVPVLLPVLMHVPVRMKLSFDTPALKPWQRVMELGDVSTEQPAIRALAAVLTLALALALALAVSLALVL